MSRVSQHPNIVHLQDLFADEEKIYIVMEYMRGGELYEKITKQKVFSEREASTVMAEIIKVIQYLHSNNIVHRDLKPSNILYIDETHHPSTLRVSDFGFAKLLRHDNGMLMTPCFTANFVAPEVLKKQGYDKSCDMWSLGIMLFIMLTGKVPFSTKMESDKDGNLADPSAEILSKISALDINQATSGRSWSMISEQGKDLVCKLLNKDSAKRITAEQALIHPWIVQRDILPDCHLPVKRDKADISAVKKLTEAMRPEANESKTKSLFKLGPVPGLGRKKK